MKNLENFKLTNEMLSKVFGGALSEGFPRTYSFTGIDAQMRAAAIATVDSTCTYGCSCQNGAGGGSGAGGTNPVPSYQVSALVTATHAVLASKYL
jgi:hypothetical protein